VQLFAARMTGTVTTSGRVDAASLALGKNAKLNLRIRIQVIDMHPTNPTEMQRRSKAVPLVSHIRQAHCSRLAL
jgi:hypothetical protein